MSRQAVWSKAHPWELILGDLEAGVKTRSATRNECFYSGFLSQEEQKKVEYALNDPDWVVAIQDELNQFERHKYESWYLGQMTNMSLAPNGYSEINWMRMT